jgi:hypothetical protein
LLDEPADQPDPGGVFDAVEQFDGGVWVTARSIISRGSSVRKQRENGQPVRRWQLARGRRDLGDSACPLSRSNRRPANRLRRPLTPARYRSIRGGSLL